MSIPQEICHTYYQAVTSLIYRGCCTAYFICSAIGLIASVPIIRNMPKMSIFHPNLKMLLYFNIFYTTGYSAVVFSSMIHFGFYAITHEKECDVVFQSRKCLWSFIPLNWCMTGMCVTQGFISFERHVSSVYAEKYEYSGKRLGYTLGALNVIVPTLLTVYGLQGTDLSDAQPICMSTPSSTTGTMNQLFLLLVIIEILSIATFSYDWRFNKRLLKTSEYTLTKRFHVFENVTVIRVCLPLTLVHFFLTATYMTVILLLRSKREYFDPVIFRLLSVCVYLIPYYAALHGIFLLYILSQQRKERERAEAERVSSQQADKSRNIYFTELENQWKHPRIKRNA